jgi:hypothetical protein
MLKMKTSTRSLFALLGLALLSVSADAGLSPLGVSIVPPVEFPAQDFTITGARISAIWGDHKNVYGLDLGLVGNMTDGEMVGVGVSGVFNYNKGVTTGVFLQAAGLGNFNVNKAMIYGVQLAGLVNSNKAESRVVGLQLAAVNLANYTDIRGVQAGVYNTARDVVGFQIGLINKCDSLHGLQIGLINFHTRGLFSVAPILNVGF